MIYSDRFNNAFHPSGVYMGAIAIGGNSNSNSNSNSMSTSPSPSASEHATTLYLTSYPPLILILILSTCKRHKPQSQLLALLPIQSLSFP